MARRLWLALLVQGVGASFIHPDTKAATVKGHIDAVLLETRRV